MKKEMNNKGFSLVELIIVIAIMVILVAVLAPQYLRYVEKSRVSTDTQTTVEFINALQTAVSDPDADLTGLGSTVAITSGGGASAITVPSTLQAVLGPSGIGVLDTTAMTKSVYQSKAYTAADISLTLTYDGTHQVWKLTTGGVDQSGAIPKS